MKKSSTVETPIWDPSKQTEVEVTIPAEPKVKVEITQPAKKEKAKEKSVPKTKQKYLNPATGAMVGYVRAKNLGLI